MSDAIPTIQRRRMLKAAAGATLSQLLGSSPAFSSPAKTPGKAGDFDFLNGSWNIHHRRLKTAGGADWDEFSGEATCWSILGGVGSIEELRIPARHFSGLGLRLLDVDQRLWFDYWVNANSGVLAPPGTPGYFEQGVGIFESDDVDAGVPIKVRGVWDRITPTSCRWYQATSRNEGKTWEQNWLMDWTRAK
jgi:hypothetical protein